MNFKPIIASLALVSGLLLCNFSHAQSKEETEKWILEKAGYNSLGLSYEFSDADLIIKIETPYIAGGGLTKRTVPLKNITSISYSHTDTYLSYFLNCANEDECVYQVVTDGDDKFESEKRHKRALFEIYQKLDAAFVPRMTKALLHLIKLNGGEAKLVPNAVKKEAF